MRISVGIVKLGNSLVFVRRKKAPLKDLLILPGGKIKDKETPEEALARKIYEETGLTLAQKEFVGEYYESLVENGKVYGHEISVFLCSATGTAKNSGEVELIDENDLERRKADIAPSDYQMLDRTLKGDRNFTHEISVEKSGNSYSIFSEAEL
ncbi:MAG: NUDIX domain-containing protein [Candidatus Aenigmarchaeota archaeon]|nr:NUDIX domain-containing protein [Candidatus Aenigmarchaeota archaeon]